MSSRAARAKGRSLRRRPRAAFYVIIAPMEPMVQCEDVHKTLRTGDGAKGHASQVFAGLNVVVARAERLGIVGPSGCGKTTLLKLINRLLDVDAGRVLVDREDVRDWEVLSLRRGAQLVPQKPFLFGETVRDNLLFGLQAAGNGGGEEGLSALLEEVALPDVGLDRPVAALSVGEQQRVCLARALALRPQILMLDETTASLEPPTARAVLERLYRRVEEEGMTLLHVTHEIPKLRALDRIVVLAAGGVAEEGTPRRILERPQVEVTREFVRGLD